MSCAIIAIWIKLCHCVCLSANPKDIQIFINPTYTPIRGIEGDILTFNCFANGFSSYLKWYKRTAGVDTELSSSLIRKDDYYSNGEPFGRSTVTIKKAKKSDGGTYVCARIVTDAIKKYKTVEIVIEGECLSWLSVRMFAQQPHTLQ